MMAIISSKVFLRKNAKVINFPLEYTIRTSPLEDRVRYEKRNPRIKSLDRLNFLKL